MKHWWLLVALAACGHSEKKAEPIAQPESGSATPTEVEVPPPPAGSAGSAGSAAPAAGSGSATPEIVLEWGGAGGRGSFAQLTIDASGTATAMYTDGRTKQTRTGHVSAADLAKLDTVLAKHHACTLKPDPHYVAVPEEHHTRLMANLSTIKCTVELHQNEWSKSIDGKAIETAIDAIDAKLK